MPSYRFIFERGATTRVPFQFQTVNGDSTRTPINLTGKRITLRFRVRDAATAMMSLDSNHQAQLHEARIEIVNAAEGRFQVVVPTAQINFMTVGVFGDWKMMLHESSGDSRLLSKGAFSVR